MVVQFCKYAKPVHILNRQILWASLVAQMVKNLPAMQETQVLSLGQEDPLGGKGVWGGGGWKMATHSSILA